MEETTLAMKLFLASAVAWVTGRSTHLKIKGTPEEVDVITAALHATKDLFDALALEDITIEEVVQKLNIKNARASDFEALTGTRWPL